MNSRRWTSLICVTALALLPSCAPETAGVAASDAELRTDATSAVLTTRSIAHVGFPARPAHVGDFDGDGRDDVLELVRASGTGTLALRVTLVRATGPASPITTSLGDPMPTTPVVVADVNGDGRDDVVVTGNGIAGGAGLGILTYVSSPTAGFARRVQRLGDGVAVAARPPLVGDVDGDGRDDLVFVYAGATSITTRTKLSRADGTWGAGAEASLAAPSSLLPSVQARLADLDGDLRADLVAAGFDLDGPSTGFAVRARRGRGDGGWIAADTRHPAVPRAALERPMALRDFDGDAVPELALLSTDRLWILRWAEGRFADSIPVPTGLGSFPTSAPVVVADVDGDGLLDVSTSRSIRTTVGTITTEQLEVATFRTGGLGGTSTVRSSAPIDGATPPVAVDLDGDRRSDVVFHTTGPGTPRLAATIRRSDFLERTQDAHRRGDARAYEDRTSELTRAVGRMTPRQCIAGIEDVATVVAARGLAGLEGPLLTLLDCAATDIRPGSEHERAAARALAALRDALARPAPAPSGVPVPIVRVAGADRMRTHALRPEAASVFLGWFTGHDRRVGRLGLGDAVADPGTEIALCGLPLMRDAAGELLDAEVLRIGACAFGGSSHPGAMADAHCRAVAEGRGQYASADEVAARPARSSLTHRPDGGFSLSLGGADVRRLERLLDGACAGMTTGARAGELGLEPYTVESCIEGSTAEVETYGAVATAIADCYAPAEGSPIPVDGAVTIDQLAEGVLGDGRGAVVESIFNFALGQLLGPLVEAARAYGVHFTPMAFPPGTEPDGTVVVHTRDDVFSGHGDTVRRTGPITLPGGRTGTAETTLRYDRTPNGGRILRSAEYRDSETNSFTLERVETLASDVQHAMFGAPKQWTYRVRSFQGGSPTGESRLVVTRFASGSVTARCTGTANAACEQAAREVFAAETVEIGESSLEPPGFDLSRESCQQLSDMGLLTGRREGAIELLFGAGLVPSRAWYERPTGEELDPSTARHLDDMRCIPEGTTERSPADRACGLVSCNLGSLGTAIDGGCACISRPSTMTAELASELVRCHAITCPPGSRTEVAGSSCVCVAEDATSPECTDPRPTSDVGVSRPFCPTPPSR
jgi:hypothetical protein